MDGVVGFLIGLFVVGLVAGIVARLFVGAPRRMGCLGTALLGIVGSYAGGTLAVLLFHETWDIRRAGTLIGAIVGSAVVLLAWKWFLGVAGLPRRTRLR